MSLAEAERVVTRGDNKPPLKERLALDYQSLVDQAQAVAERANALPKVIASDADLGPIGGVVKDARRLKSDAEAAHKTEKAPHLQAGRDVDAFFAIVTDRMKRVIDALEERATIWQRAKEAEERRRREEEARKLREEEEHKRQVAAAEAERNRHTAAAKKEAEAEQIADKAAMAEAAAQAPAADLTRVRSDDGSLATTTTKWGSEIVDYDAIDLNQLRHHFARADVEKAIRAYVKVHRNSRPIAGVRIFADTRATFR